MGLGAIRESGFRWFIRRAKNTRESLYSWLLQAIPRRRSELKYLSTSRHQLVIVLIEELVKLVQMGHPLPTQRTSFLGVKESKPMISAQALLLRAMSMVVSCDVGPNRFSTLISRALLNLRFLPSAKNRVSCFPTHHHQPTHPQNQTPKTPKTFCCVRSQVHQPRQPRIELTSSIITIKMMMTTANLSHPPNLHYSPPPPPPRNAKKPLPLVPLAILKSAIVLTCLGADFVTKPMSIWISPISRTNPPAQSAENLVAFLTTNTNTTPKFPNPHPPPNFNPNPNPNHKTRQPMR